MTDRFLSRWSRLKRENQNASDKPGDVESDSQPTDQPTKAVEPEFKVEQQPSASTPGNLVVDDTSVGSVDVDAALPTEQDLDDVFQDGGIQKFLSPKIDDSLRNKAFKNLFKLPELGIVDYLDVYMEDFNVYEKLDESEINKMESAKALLSRVDLLNDEVLNAEAKDALPQKDDSSVKAEQLPLAGDTVSNPDPTEKPDSE